jgi:hypothetical protein
VSLPALVRENASVVADGEQYAAPALAIVAGHFRYRCFHAGQAEHGVADVAA